MTPNMPILYRNIIDGLPNDFARDVFLWAVERPNQDRFLYGAERFAREADMLARAIPDLLSLANYSRFKRRDTVLDDDQINDLRCFILKRHVNAFSGGNSDLPSFYRATQ